MKILLISRAYPSTKVAEKNFILPELKALVGFGYDITLMPLSCSEREDQDIPGTIVVDRALSKLFRGQKYPMLLLGLLRNKGFYGEFWRNKFLLLTSATRLLNFLKFSLKSEAVYRVLKAERECFDLIYTYWCSGETLGALRYRHEYNSGAKVLSRFHGYDIYAERIENAGYLAYRPYVLSELDTGITLSQQAKDYLFEKYSVDPRKVIASPLGVKTQSSVDRAEHKDGFVTFFSCSYASPVKRIQLIYETVVEFAKSNPNFKIVWHHYGATESAIRAIEPRPNNFKCVLYGVTEQEVFLKDYQTSPSPVFLNLSRSEGQPVSVMEAMSCGVPVIATDVGGVAEMLGKGGILCSVTENASEVSAKVLLLVSDPEKYKTCSQLAIEQQRNKYDQDKNHAVLAQEISQLMDNYQL